MAIVPDLFSGYLSGVRAANQDNWNDLNQYNRVLDGQLTNAMGIATFGNRFNQNQYQTNEQARQNALQGAAFPGLYAEQGAISRNVVQNADQLGRLNVQNRLGGFQAAVQQGQQRSAVPSLPSGTSAPSTISTPSGETPSTVNPVTPIPGLTQETPAATTPATPVQQTPVSPSTPGALTDEQRARLESINADQAIVSQLEAQGITAPSLEFFEWENPQSGIVPIPEGLLSVPAVGYDRSNIGVSGQDRIIGDIIAAATYENPIFAGPLGLIGATRRANERAQGPVGNGIYNQQDTNFERFPLSELQSRFGIPPDALATIPPGQALVTPDNIVIARDANGRFWASSIDPSTGRSTEIVPIETPQIPALTPGG